MMRVVCVGIIVVTAFATIGGCDGGGLGSLLAQGSVSLGVGSTLVLATLTINQPGTLHGTMTWSGPPTELAEGFKHVATGTTIGYTIGSSPTTTTVAVTTDRVAAGTEWQFLAANGGASAASIQFEVRFEPD
jgi:hypothetical protein